MRATFSFMCAATGSPKFKQLNRTLVQYEGQWYFIQERPLEEEHHEILLEFREWKRPKAIRIERKDGTIEWQIYGVPPSAEGQAKQEAWEAWYQAHKKSAA